jgi:hypothetical protein
MSDDSLMLPKLIRQAITIGENYEK